MWEMSSVNPELSDYLLSKPKIRLYSKERHPCTNQRRSSSAKDFCSATLVFFPWVFSLPEPPESSKELWKTIESGFCTVRDEASVEWGGLGVEKLKSSIFLESLHNFFYVGEKGGLQGKTGL